MRQVSAGVVGVVQCKGQTDRGDNGLSGSHPVEHTQGPGAGEREITWGCLFGDNVQLRWIHS